MARLSEQEINQVRSRASIVDVVSHYIPLTRKGRNYVALCPFHDDHNPSMSISEDKQIYKCFVCGAGGNVFTFVSNYEKISFLEAVYKVADYAGITLSAPLQQTIAANVDPHTAQLYRLLKEMIQFSQYELDTEEGSHARRYLQQRGLNEDIIKRFQIGYNPHEDGVYQYLRAKEFRDADMAECGIAGLVGSRMLDRFANRVLIPIHDAVGNPVGFTARRLDDSSQEAKYINTSDTSIYHKGNLLFNYHRVKEAVKQDRRVFLTEGAMDVLAFEKADLHTALATLGTACTKEQTHLLKALHVPVTVCYDGDAAGQNATYKFAKAAMEAGLTVEIMNNTSGLDPDEIVETYGKQELRSLCEKTISFIDFLFSYLQKRYNLENYTQKKEYAIEIADWIRRVSDEFERKNYYLRLKELSGFDMEVTQPEKKETSTVKKQYQKQRYLQFPKSGRERAEYEILSQMLLGVNAAETFKEELGFFKDDNSNKLAMYIIDYYRTHEILSVSELYDQITEDVVRDLLLSVAQWELASANVEQDVLIEAVKKVKACILEDKIQALNEKAKNMSDPLQKAEIAKEKNALILKRNELIHKEGSR